MYILFIHIYNLAIQKWRLKKRYIAGRIDNFSQTYIKKTKVLLN